MQKNKILIKQKILMLKTSEENFKLLANIIINDCILFFPFRAKIITK